MNITRIAPSPTGHFHIGTARTAYFNYLYAKATNGKFILRIDDTDNSRNNSEYTDTIFKSLEWLELEYDEVHYQSKRLDLYKEVVSKLLKKKLAMRYPDNSIRLNLPYQNAMSFVDDLRGIIPISQDDFNHHKNILLMRSDGTPVYNFATVVDDIDMNITHIIRGSDHLSNVHKQEAIKVCINPKAKFNYAHLGLIMLNGKKISKRNPEHVEIASLQTYIDKDFIPAAFKNFILRIGWSPKVDDKTKSIILQEEAIKLFVEYGNMKPHNANMDLNHLNSYQKKYGKIYVKI
jgi:glutamyl/glutaminyl-tRNA synthetase